MSSTGMSSVVQNTFDAVGRLRPADKPLHPKGVVVPATVHRYGTAEVFGAPWLDDPGTDSALVRLSRAVGLPKSLPDFLGLALRLTPQGRPADLLFATTGRSVLRRFVLSLHRDVVWSPTTYTTLLPYRTRTGAVLLAATPGQTGGEIRVTLAAARPTGRWHDFGAIEIPSLTGTDQPVSFDPVLNQLDGLEPYRAWAQLREAAYAGARHSRDVSA